MVEAFDIVFLVRIVQAVIILVGAFLLEKIFNRLLTKVIEATNDARKRVINNVRRFLQIIIYLVALVRFCGFSKWTLQVCLLASV
jgi:small-conductance mechanosensitive channel